MRRPLEDVTILAVEQYGAGPWGTVHLADLGARIIKIEDPTSKGDIGRYVPPFQEGEDSLFFETFCHNKESISLQLRSPEGRATFERLVPHADAVFSNLRGDGPAKLKILYDDLKHLNPAIVCASLTGFGMTGPRAAEGGYDYIAQGMAGWMSLTGDPDGPRQYDDPEFDPFWKACVDHNLAVTIHLGARMARPGQFKFLPNMVMSKLCMAEPIAILVFGGVFDRFPDLRYGAIESGAGWLAFVAEYMDNIYDSQRHWLKLDLKLKPSEYFDRNIYASFIRDPVGIRNRNLKGAGNIMWSTDYPHSETTWPESVKTMEWQFEGVSEEEMRPIVRDNARRFYGLD